LADVKIGMVASPVGHFEAFLVETRRLTTSPSAYQTNIGNGLSGKALGVLLLAAGFQL
jgi:hypothetical protein